MHQIGEAAAPSFTAPVAMLRACHQRILQQCDTLERLPSYIAEHGADEQVRQAAGKILRYFSQAGLAHHEDEEEQLFPWLLAQPTFPEDLRKMLRNLIQEHRQLDAAWAELAPDLRVLEAGGQIRWLHIAPFVTIHRRHIVVENEHIFPVAEALLDAETAQRIGMQMAERRRLGGES
ncbi:hemerythrin domain-containing protein [Acidithiobacillus sp. CV18-2]|uniref:Hemerythrin domain-containing protein n=1 Tax=Igneacidithiobacillus copahuensis TaxID=2724909 RepID=A0AAE2YMD8_9PROT|nr:hemerythrin domain-containing protein [Igneacidithiobacillus copahuensis]MBU2753442.1 hemerythrin domain-containing protein [Acidithiobacillus sp. CV18-3]MBU2758158.1 hemerythrin domain-containing protein [Acidithiobacillus sp. BN09-2]MBU2778418.1 hemerythrin domain-containing protein [Acidithiobacillus sp. CV18-2]MBU2796083.1 hemerythrin domain-containing protein [Acidithiobacillus sp. VAN18-2]MBU2799959.1 hemerythrin domain-containing protein [Acidithiobacillus sp. VAN18-4]UTV80355.1 hem